jgi:hypothetical protein
LKSKKWAFFKGTGHRKTIGTNERLLFYCSDPQVGGQIIASATVRLVRPATRVEANLVESGMAETIVEFDQINEYSDPVSFRSVLPSLSIAPKNMKKWGVVVFAGCRSISDADFHLIENAPKEVRISNTLVDSK